MKLNILLMLLMMAGTTAMAEDALEIVRKSEQKMRGNSSYVEMTMTVVRADWTRETALKSWAKGDSLALIQITSPARDKGSAFLKIRRDLWNWVPSIERMVKIPPSMMMQSWMGSDFTNDDLVKQSSIVSDYTHALQGEEQIGEASCYKLALKPKPEAPVVWGKVLLWISKADYLHRKIEFFDEDDTLIQTMNLTDIKPLGGRLVPTRLEMLPADPEKRGQKTEIVYQKGEFDQKIEDSFFSQQNMKRGR